MDSNFHIPEVMIIGAGRSGTTSLYHYLKTHPGICFSRHKELLYFSNSDLYARGTSYLESFFDHCTPGQVTVSSDTYLLPSKDAPPRMHAHNSKMKIIALLRDPVKRAVSSFQYALNNGYQDSSLTLEKHFSVEKDLILGQDILRVNNLGHFYSGLYHRHLSEWNKYFPRDQMLVLNSEIFFREPETVMRKVYDYIGVEKNHILPSYETHNSSAKSRSRKLQQFLANRNHPARQWLRDCVPQKLKDFIFQSGIVELLKHANRSGSMPAQKTDLTKEEKELFHSYYQEDQRLLHEHYGITHF